MTSESNRSGPSRADLLRQKRQHADQQRANAARPQPSGRPQPVGRIQPSGRPQPSSGQPANRNSGVTSHAIPNPLRQSVRPQPVSRNGAPAPRSTPPVRVSTTTVRRTTPYAFPNAQATRTAPARKLHYARGANGVEVRLPALPALQFNWQMASAFLAFALLILVIMLTSLDTFHVSSVQLKGNQRVSAADVQTAVFATSHSIFTLDRSATIAAVQAAFPEFSKIDLRVGLPNSVSLSVTERQPILAWVTKDQTLWISADGVIMPARGDASSVLQVKSSAGIPTLSASADSTPADTAAAAATPAAPATDTSAAASTAAVAPAAPTGLQYIDPQVLQAAISLSAQMPSGGSLVYDPVSGMGWSDPKGWQVYFGVDLSNIAAKQAEYQAIVQRLTDLGIKPSLISVALLDAPYYRTE